MSKIKYVGLSEASAKTIRAAHAVHPISAVQLEWSLWARDVEKDVIPTCRELGIGIVAYSPLGRGFLADQFKDVTDLKEGDWRANTPRFTEENFAKNMKYLETVKKMAEKKGCTVGQFSLGWVMNQGTDVCPIPGTSKLTHLQENLNASNIKFTAEELKAITEPEIAGARYAKGFPTFEDN